MRLSGVFIIDDWTEQIERLAIEHSEANVDVYVVRDAELEPDLVINVAIYDMSFAAYELANANGVAVEDVFTVNSSDIERFRSLFERLKTRSIPLEEFRSAHPAVPTIHVVEQAR